MVSDGLGRFTFAALMGPIHDREITGGGKASVLNEKFKVVNTLTGNIKTASMGIYHAVKFAKGHRYLFKVQFRFNRHSNMLPVLDNLLNPPVSTAGPLEQGITVADIHRQTGVELLGRLADPP